ncbi:MAG: GAF domain-containing protein [Pirellulaceae bacterium]|nr:GAF domain-containing protein [Pirellulaceae bacterium]
MKRKDESVFYVDVSATLVHLKGERLLMGQFRDMTERRQAQKEMRTRARQLAALNSLSRRVNSRLDLDQVVQQALEGVAEEVGSDQQLLFLRREGDEDLYQIHPNTASFSCEAIIAHSAGECLFGRAFSSLEPVYSRDISDDSRCTRNECRQAGFRSLAALPLISGDEAFGVLGVASKTIRDFGEESTFLGTMTNEIAAGLSNARLYDEVRRHGDELASAYEKIQRMNAELERRVEQRTAEVQSANQELEAFTYSVAHDLRAPLRAMEGFATALAEDCSDRLGADGREYCQHIADSAQRMDELINDLLAYSRLGRTELRMQPVGVERAVRQAIGQLESEIDERQAFVVVEGTLPDVMAHYSTIVQISANLISNAVKFVAPDVRPEVRIRAEPREGSVRLWVEDNGIGIDDEYHERVFRVFERLHGIESYPGTGIGLAIVSRAVNRLGGRCGVESRPGTGSRFWVEFNAEEEGDA